MLEQENKEAWFLRVSNKLGFSTMPPDLLPAVVTLYDNGYREFQAVDQLKRLLLVTPVRPGYIKSPYIPTGIN